MARVAGSYQSVTRGVSQQAPQDRRQGTYNEQINMVPDPVRGLARRRGSRIMQEMQLADATAPILAATQFDSENYRKVEIIVGGSEYVIFYRTTAKQAGSALPFAVCFNKTTNEFVPLQGDVNTAAFEAAGATAACSLGRFAVFGSTGQVTAQELWNTTSNRRRGVVWVRRGEYFKRYSVSAAVAANPAAQSSIFFTGTVQQAYPFPLDTSGISFSDPEYQKLVNDATNSYNSAVTAWINTSATSVSPQDIARRMRDFAQLNSWVGVELYGEFLYLPESMNIVDLRHRADFTGDANNPGPASAESLSVCLGEVSEVGDLPPKHKPGTIVKIASKRGSGEDAYFVKAVANNPADTGFTSVTWVECAGTEYTFPHFYVATVHAGTLVLRRGIDTLGDAIGETITGPAKSVAGDAISCPPPRLPSGQMDYLGVFQDRLVVGSGATLLFSRTGDYFNFFRSSVLTVVDSDPFEVVLEGSENDTVKYSVLYDRNLVLFGDKGQYAVNGRQTLTPTTAIIGVMASHENAIGAPPVATGNLVIFAKSAEGSSSLHQLQTGLTQDSPEAYELSQQLDSYLEGEPVEILPTTSPNVVLLRTTGLTDGLYMYSYLDSPNGERLWDAWSKWKWGLSMGTVVGLADRDGEVLALMLRTGKTLAGTDRIWLAVESFSLRTEFDDMPHLDSLRPAIGLDSATGWLNQTGIADKGAAVAMDNSGSYPLLGTSIDSLSDLDEFFDAVPDAYSRGWLGVQFPAEASPTNPFYRDREGKAIVSGRLTLVSVLATVEGTGGLEAYVTYGGAERRVLRFIGRSTGFASSSPGQQPVVSKQVQFIVGREVRECSYTLKAVEWLPLTVTALEWKGQYFNNARR